MCAFLCVQLPRNVAGRAALADPGRDQVPAKMCASHVCMHSRSMHIVMHSRAWTLVELRIGGACLGRAARGYTTEQLRGIMDERDKIWADMCGAGRVPAFLQQWREYVLGLGPLDTPDYGGLRRLLERSARCVDGLLSEDVSGFSAKGGLGSLPAARGTSGHQALGALFGTACQTTQRYGDVTPVLEAANVAYNAEAPSTARPLRSKRMRPASGPAAMPLAWHKVAKRLCPGPSATALAPEE